MYRREALINERNAEVAWINGLLDASRTIEFQPEIVRELETITTISAALGLSFDPASGLNYRRAEETGALQQEIEVERLRLQLEQLQLQLAQYRRDAELVRTGFADQGGPVNPGVGQLQPIASTAVPPAASTASTAAADQLKAAIDRLLPALTGRLDAVGKPAILANSSVNPADLFRDRLAYRDILRSARNAASLDELHDFQGAALIRLNFEATVIPDRSRARAPGVIQMQIVSPVFTPVERERLYLGWLGYINEQIVANARSPDPELLRSAVVDNLDLVDFHYAPAAGAGATTCPGFRLLYETVPATGGCATIRLAVPRFRGLSAQEGAYSSLGHYVSFYFDFSTTEDHDRGLFQRAAELILSDGGALVTNCAWRTAGPVRGGSAPSSAQYLERMVEVARGRVAAGDAFATISRVARGAAAVGQTSADAQYRASVIAARTSRAQLLLTSFERFAFVGCSDDKIRDFRSATPSPEVPPGFVNILTSDTERVSIYEIGPREQVQQVSTTARAANSLALAVSLAASAPGSGQAASAAGNYSRQAMGRAATLERVPAVVGYSVGAEQTFGWVLAPRATIDPRGRVELEHGLRNYDLSVDLSVPSWWPAFDLQTLTAWSPDISSISSGAIEARNGSPPNLVRISLSQNNADYAALTRRISLGSIEPRRRTMLDQQLLADQRVYACRATTLILKGDNLWRASVALINGHRLGSEAINVAPDMSGILLAVPALDGPLRETRATQVTLRMLTPYGEVEGEVDFVPKPAEGCQPTERRAADSPAASGPAIANVDPTQFAVPAAVRFQVTGTLLNQVSRITLNGQLGTVTIGEGGQSLVVTFTREQTESLPVSRTVQLNFYKGQERIEGRMVEVTANRGGNR